MILVLTSSPGSIYDTGPSLDHGPGSIYDTGPNL